MFKPFRVLLIAVLLLATLWAALPALAQGGTPISYGQAVTGEITNDAYELFYTFQGTAGDAITISMTASQQGLDSYLELRGPDGASLMTDDDSGGNLNSLLGPYTLSQNGAYTVVATRFMRQDGSSSGAFTLVVNRVAVVPLSLNEAVSVELSDSQPSLFFAYSAAPGQVLSLEGQGLGGETGFSIGVRDRDGFYVNQTYGDANGLALLDPLFLDTGDYTFTVRREQGFGPGVVSGGTVRVALTMRVVETQPIPFGTPVSGTLSDANPADHFVFNGNQGDLLRLSGQQDPAGQPFEAQVYAPEGYAFNGGSTAYGEVPGSFVIDPLQLDSSGQFLVVVRRFAPQGPGTDAGTTSGYTLTLSQTETPVLASGVEVTGTFDGQSYERVYRFDGMAGQAVRITLRSLDDSYGPSLDVQGPAFETPGMPTEGGVGGGGPGGSFVLNLNSAVPGTMTYELTLPATGTYLFRVHNGAPFAGPAPTGGTFGLTVEVVR